MYLYGGGPDGTPAAPGDEQYRLDKDVQAITNEQIVEISEISRTSHHINTRILWATAEPTIKTPTHGPDANGNNVDQLGSKIQPYFWARWDDKFWNPLPFMVETGSISESLTNDTTRSLNLTVHSDHWTPFEQFQSQVSPFRTLLRVERGVEVAYSTSTPPPAPGTSTTIWIPLGIYRIHKVNFVRDHTADIEAYSLDQVLKDYLYDAIPAPLTAPMSWMRLWEEKWLAGGVDAPGQQDYSHITRELRSITPDAALKVVGENYQPGFQVASSFNRWAGIKEMLEAKSFALYVNRVGKPIIVQIPKPDDAVTDWVPQELQDQLVMNEGANGNIISRTEDFNRDGLFNYVMAYGEIAPDPGAPSNTGTPVSKLVHDDSDLSLTYIGGPFGRIGVELQVEDVIDVGKLEVQAKAKLAQTKILTTKSNLSLLPNPTVEVGDRIKVHYPNGAYRWFIIDSATIPLVSSTELSITGYTYDNARINANVPPPTNLRIDAGPTDSEVTISFDGYEGATGYEWTSDAALFWNPAPTTTLPPVEGQINPRIQMRITGLRPLAVYSIRIRTKVEDSWIAPPVVMTNAGERVVRGPGTLLVAEAGWPGWFPEEPGTPANIVVANLYDAYHVRPVPGSPFGTNDPWINDEFVVMDDGMLATWNGQKFIQRF